MPRKPLKLPDDLEYISVLDEHGHLDESIAPKLSEDFLRQLFRAMVLGRRFDERQLSLQRQGRLGTFPPILGQEASQIGAIAALEPDDWMVPAFRETAAELYRGRSMESVLLAYNGFNEGGLIPEELNNLPVSVPVGSQALHAVGLAWAMKYRGESNVAMTFMGDGATSQGDFHEALNFSGVFRIPVVFVCQNNQWAISIPLSRQTNSRTLAQKAVAYGIKGVQVDGNDIFAVYLAASEAVQRARQGQGPTLIECVTYRMSLHTTADDPKRYRSDEEVEQWKARDPLMRFRRWLIETHRLEDDDIRVMEAEIAEEIQRAVETAEDRMRQFVDPLAMFDHIYETRDPHLEAQRRQLTEELALEKKEVDHG
jgi:pyruvate dehydrogenase E1 component alpha subunit